jgi:hypothetical protein
MIFTVVRNGYGTKETGQLGPRQLRPLFKDNYDQYLV